MQDIKEYLGIGADAFFLALYNNPQKIILNNYPLDNWRGYC